MEARPMVLRKLSASRALALVAALLAFSLTRGQTSLPHVPGPNPATESKATVTKTAPPAVPPARDLAKLSPLQRQMYLSAQRGADWLYRANQPDGRFKHGYNPSLNTSLEG